MDMMYSISAWSRLAPQTYRIEEDKKRKYKPDKKFNKKYYLKRSIRRKPYLDPNKHVRKYNPRRIYKNKLRLYACGELDHLSNICPRKKNLYDTRSLLLECTNEELVEVDEDISDIETIYSIVSVKDGKENSESENEDLDIELDLFITEFMDQVIDSESNQVKIDELYKAKNILYSKLK